MLRVIVAEMGQHLIERSPPGSVAPFGEVTARLAGPDPADADVFALPALLWPRISASVAGYLAGGTDEKLRDVQTARSGSWTEPSATSSGMPPLAVLYEATGGLREGFGEGSACWSSERLICSPCWAGSHVVAATCHSGKLDAYFPLWKLQGVVRRPTRPQRRCSPPALPGTSSRIG